MPRTSTQPQDLAAGTQPTVQAGPAESGPETATATGQEPARWSWADAGLWAVACSGFALSYSSVQRAAVSHVDHESLSYLLPVATDGGALAAAARYVADRRKGVAGARGWQLLTWAAIAASAALNAMGRNWQDAVWHLVGPGALAVITELYAHRAAQLHKNEAGPRESIPVRLWVTSPRSSFRLWLWTARTGEGSLAAARQAMDRYAAAQEALESACRARADRRIRNLARDQLRSGVLPPVAVLQVLGWGTGQAPEDAPAALRVLLATVDQVSAADDPADGPQALVEVHVLTPAPAENPAEPHAIEPAHCDRLAVEAGPALPGPGPEGGPAIGPVGDDPVDRPAGPVDRAESGPAVHCGGPVDRSGDGPVDRSVGGPVVRLVTDRSSDGPVDRSGGSVARRSMPVVRSAGGPADQAPARTSDPDRSMSERVERAAGEDRTTALLPAAREIAAAHLAAKGRPIGRRPLAAALREAGESCSSDVAAALLELLGDQPRQEEIPIPEEASSA
jgi:hypothetical protein